MDFAEDELVQQQLTARSQQHSIGATKTHKKIHEFSVISLNLLKSLMDFGFYFRDITTTNKLRDLKQQFLSTILLPNITPFEKWKTSKGMFAITYIEAMLVYGKRFDISDSTINGLSQCADHLETYTYFESPNTQAPVAAAAATTTTPTVPAPSIEEDQTLVNCERESYILQIVLCLLRVRIIVLQSSQAASIQTSTTKPAIPLSLIETEFQQKLHVVRSVMLTKNPSWVLIGPLLTVISMSHFDRNDFKGSTILLRKAIKTFTTVLNDVSFEEFLPTPEKKLKLLSYLYFCQIKLVKAMFELNARTKESFQLERFLLLISSDKYLNEQQKTMLSNKFKKIYTKQLAKILPASSENNPFLLASKHMHLSTNSRNAAIPTSNNLRRTSFHENSGAELAASPLRIKAPNLTLQRTKSINTNNMTSSQRDPTQQQQPQAQSMLSSRRLNNQQDGMRVSVGSSSIDVRDSDNNLEGFNNEDEDFAELSITLPHANESFMQRYVEEKTRSTKEQALLSKDIKQIGEIQKSLLLSRIHQFKHTVSQPIIKLSLNPKSQQPSLTELPLHSPQQHKVAFQESHFPHSHRKTLSSHEFQAPQMSNRAAYISGTAAAATTKIGIINREETSSPQSTNRSKKRVASAYLPASCKQKRAVVSQHQLAASAATSNQSNLLLPHQRTNLQSAIKLQLQYQQTQQNQLQNQQQQHPDDAGGMNRIELFQSKSPQGSSETNMNNNYNNNEFTPKGNSNVSLRFHHGFHSRPGSGSFNASSIQSGHHVKGNKGLPYPQNITATTASTTKTPQADSASKLATFSASKLAGVKVNLSERNLYNVILHGQESTKSTFQNTNQNYSLKKQQISRKHLVKSTVHNAGTATGASHVAATGSIDFSNLGTPADISSASISTEQTNDSNQISCTSLPRRIADLGTKTMNARPNWVLSDEERQRILKGQKKFKHEQGEELSAQQKNPIQELIEAGQIVIDQKHPSAFDPTIRYPNLSIALKNVEQERLIFELCQRSRASEFVSEIQKQKVKDIILNRQTIPRFQTPASINGQPESTLTNLKEQPLKTEEERESTTEQKQQKSICPVIETFETSQNNSDYSHMSGSATIRMKTQENQQDRQGIILPNQIESPDELFNKRKTLILRDKRFQQNFKLLDSFGESSRGSFTPGSISASGTSPELHANKHLQKQATSNFALANPKKSINDSDSISVAGLAANQSDLDIEDDNGRKLFEVSIFGEKRSIMQISTDNIRSDHDFSCHHNGKTDELSHDSNDNLSEFSQSDSEDDEEQIEKENDKQTLETHPDYTEEKDQVGQLSKDPNAETNLQFTSASQSSQRQSLNDPSTPQKSKNRISIDPSNTPRRSGFWQKIQPPQPSISLHALVKSKMQIHKLSGLSPSDIQNIFHSATKETLSYYDTQIRNLHSSFAQILFIWKQNQFPFSKFNTFHQTEKTALKIDEYSSYLTEQRELFFPEIPFIHFNRSFTISFEQIADYSRGRLSILKIASKGETHLIELSMKFSPKDTESYIQQIKQSQTQIPPTAIDTATSIWPLILVSLKQYLLSKNSSSLFSDSVIEDGLILQSQKDQINPKEFPDAASATETTPNNNNASDSTKVHLKKQPILQFHFVDSNQSNSNSSPGAPSFRMLRRSMSMASHIPRRLKISPAFQGLLRDKDNRSIVAIKNLFQAFITYCMLHVRTETGLSYRLSFDQPHIDAVNSQMILSQVRLHQKAIIKAYLTQSQLNLPGIPVEMPLLGAVQNSQPGWATRLLVVEDDLTSSQKWNKDEKIALQRWVRYQKRQFERQKEQKRQLSVLLQEQKSKIISYLEKQIATKILLGVYLKKMYISTYLPSYILVRVSIRFPTKLNLSEAIDKYCRFKFQPFLFVVEGRDALTLELIGTEEISVTRLIEENLLPQQQLPSIITLAVLTRQIPKNFKRIINRILTSHFTLIKHNQSKSNASGQPHQKQLQIPPLQLNNNTPTNLNQEKANTPTIASTAQFRLAFSTKLSGQHSAYGNQEKNDGFEDFSNEQNGETGNQYEDLPQIFQNLQNNNDAPPTDNELLFNDIFDSLYSKHFFKKKAIDIQSLYNNHGKIESNDGHGGNTFLHEEHDEIDENIESSPHEDMPQQKDNLTFSARLPKERKVTTTQHSVNPYLRKVSIESQFQREQSIMQFEEPNVLSPPKSKTIRIIGAIANAAGGASSSMKITPQQHLQSEYNQNNLSYNNISLESSFVSVNTQMNVNQPSSTQFKLPSTSFGNMNRSLLLRINWKKNGFNGSMFASMKRLLPNHQSTHEMSVKITNWVPQFQFNFEPLTFRHHVIFNRIFFAAFTDNERYGLFSKTLLSTIIQNLMQVDTKSQHTGKRVQPRRLPDQTIEQLIPTNNGSLQYHLVIESKQLLDIYNLIKESFSFTINNIGRCFVVTQCYSKAVVDLNKDKYPVLFSLLLCPSMSRTQAHRAVFSLQDIQSLEPFFVQKLLASKISRNNVHKSFKMILEKMVFIQSTVGKIPVFHSSAIVAPDYYTHALAKARKTTLRQHSYEGKKLSGIYQRNTQRLRTLQIQQEEANEIRQRMSKAKGANHLSAEMKTQSQLDSSDVEEELEVWRQHIEGLRIFRNCLQKMNFDQKAADKTSSHFLQEDVIRYRLIISQASKVSGEYIMISVYRDLLLQNWLIKYYFPRNCRYMQCHVDASDLFQANSKFLKQAVTSQIIWLQEYEYTLTFPSYLHLVQRLNINKSKQQPYTNANPFTPASKKKHNHFSPRSDKPIQEIVPITSGKSEERSRHYKHSEKPSLTYNMPANRHVRSPNGSSTNVDYRGGSPQMSPSTNTMHMSKFYAENMVKQRSERMLTHNLIPSSTSIANSISSISPEFKQRHLPSPIHRAHDVHENHDLNPATEVQIRQKSNGSFQDYVKQYVLQEKMIPRQRFNTLRPKQPTNIFQQPHSESKINVRPRQNTVEELREFRNSQFSNRRSSQKTLSPADCAAIVAASSSSNSKKEKRRTNPERLVTVNDDGSDNEDLTVNQLRTIPLPLSQPQSSSSSSLNEKSEYQPRQPRNQQVMPQIIEPIDTLASISPIKASERSLNILQSSIESNTVSPNGKKRDTQRKMSRAFEPRLLRAVEPVQQAQSNLQINPTTIKQFSENSKDSTNAIEKPHQQQHLQPLKFQSIVKKHMQGLRMANNIKNIVEFLKPKRYDKISRIEKLKNLTLIQDHNFVQKLTSDGNTVLQFASKIWPAGKPMPKSPTAADRKSPRVSTTPAPSTVRKNEHFFEKKIWETILNHIQLKTTCLQLDVGGQGINLKEILVSKFLRADKQNENFIEISIDLFEVLQKKNMQIQMQSNNGVVQDFEINFKNLLAQFLEQKDSTNSSSQNTNDIIPEFIPVSSIQASLTPSNNKQTNSAIAATTATHPQAAPSQQIVSIASPVNAYHSDIPSSSDERVRGIIPSKKSGINYFFPTEYIKYAATSAYNFRISHMNLITSTVQDIFLNCREIMNVFIAEGFFKYQANYIYSNVSYAELGNLAMFILDKIRSSNFLEMLYDKSEEKRISKVDLHSLTKPQVPPKYDKRYIRFINPQNIVYMHTKIINTLKRIYLRVSLSTHDLIFNLNVTHIGSKNSIKLSKTFTQMMRRIPFLKEHFETGEIPFVLKQVAEHYSKKLSIAWILKFDPNSN